MKNILFIISIISFLVLATEDKASFLNLFEDNEVKPAEEVFLLSYLTKESKLHLNWEIKENYYLYLNSILIKRGEDTLDYEINETNIIEHEDEFFGKTKIIRDSLNISINDEVNLAQIKVFYQGCADQGFCYPIQSKDLK